MKLSVRSWHYRLARYVFGERHLNYISLCKYFWSVVFSIILGASIVWICKKIPKVDLSISDRTAEKITTIGSIVMLGFLASLFVYALYIAWYITLLAIGALGGVIGVGIGLIYLGMFIADKMPRRVKVIKKIEPRREKQPNLALEFLKAKKSKVCPILEFEEQ